MKYWRIVNYAVGDALDVVVKQEKAAIKKMKEFGASIGAKNVAYMWSYFGGPPTEAKFVVDEISPVDTSVFTGAKKGYRSIQRKNKELTEKCNELMKGFPDNKDIFKALKITDGVQFDGNRVWGPKFWTDGKDWYVTTGDNYKGNDAVERVSDVDVESIKIKDSRKKK